MSAAKRDEDDDPPITVGQVVKWSGFAVAICGGMISVIWFAAGMKQDTGLLKQIVEQNRQRIVEVDMASQRRHTEQEREVAELRARNDQTEKVVQEMARKIDVAVAILERIDKQVGGK